MVRVVPGLTEGRNCQPGDVARNVAALEWALAEDVANRVDRPERHDEAQVEQGHQAPVDHRDDPRARDPRSSSGRTADFKSVNGGSNPPLRAITYPVYRDMLTDEVGATGRCSDRYG